MREFDRDCVYICCDESYPIKTDGEDFFVLGCTYAAFDHIESINQDVSEIKKKYGYSADYEIKWSKLNGKNFEMYRQIVNYVKKETGIFNRILVATNKTEQSFKLILPYNIFYKRMYQLLLEKIFEIQNANLISQAIIIADRRNTHSEEEMADICRRLYYNNPEIEFFSKVVDSKDYPLIQITDLLIGAASYERTGLKTSALKLEFIEFLKQTFKTGKFFGAATPLTRRKLNIFVWYGEEM